MYRTPPRTRSVARAELEAKSKLLTPIKRPATSTSAPSPTQHVADTTYVAGSSHMEHRAPSLRGDGVPHTLPPHSKVSSTSSSVSAMRKKMVLEAAKKKADLVEKQVRMQMDLIDKQLEADLADLEDEKYSSHISIASNRTRHDIENWLDDGKREHEPEMPEQPAPQDGLITGELHQSAPPIAAAGSSDGTIQMLAAAVKNLTVASAHSKSNANLLSRICTPRDLPEYSGDPLEWLQFKQAYEESTDVCKFSPKENLWRLRKCLRGQAKETVSALLMSAASPDRIMATLELRHGDPEFIVSRLVYDIKKLQPLSQEYQRDIVSFSVKVQNFVESVKAVGREEYVQGLSIVPLLISKLPTVLVSKWSDYSYPLIKAGVKSRLSIMSDFLNMEAVKITTTANVHLQNYRTDQSKYKQPDTGYSRPQALLLQTEQRSDGDKNNNDKCPFCRTQQSHKLPDCKKFKRALRKDRWHHVKRHGLCFKCLLHRHDRETCPAPMCDKEGCGGAHHRLLHYEVNDSARRPDDVNASALLLPEPAPLPDTEPAPTSASTQTPNAPGATTCFIDDKRVLLKVVPVKIQGPNGVFPTTALLDDGSSVSLLSAELAERAGLQGRSETMRVCGAWNNNVLVCEATLMTLNISSFDDTIHTLNVRSVEQLNLPVQNIKLVDCDRYEHLKALKHVLHTTEYSKPELLIGQDNYNLLLPLEICVGRYNEPSATRSPLGWCVHGTVQVAHAPRAALSAHSLHATLNLCAVPDEDAVTHALRELHEEVRRSFAIDALGVSGKPRQNAEDVQAQEMLEKSAVLVNGRWTVGLPWKEPQCRLPDSYPTAFKRLQGVEKKMLADKAYAHRYEERVNHLFENDFAREMTDTSLTPNTWYLPHFGVDNPNKKKLRLVYDAAAKCQGKSLNDYLLTGPDLLASLFGIMVRFRENRIAITGDIKDMFLRIKINSEDQNALRFLWRGSNPTGPVKTYAMTSLIFGANCSPFVAQYIKNKNASRFKSTLPAAVAAIHNQHYMDDYIDSLPDEPTAISMVKNIRDIHSAGAFEIRNWTCNSASVLDTIPKDISGTTAVTFGLDEHNEGERTLGLIWYPAKDELGFDVSFKRIPDSIIKGEQRPTKRIMLRVVMSIFDVFGFLTPFTTQGKIMLQDTWRLHINNWDDAIPDTLYKKWCSWLALLKVIGEIRLPRWYQTCATICNQTGDIMTASSSASDVVAQSYDELELHLFSDASLKAMSAVAYWRWKSNDRISIAFVASKSRVSSIKPQTVPRLELQAALLAARLADSIEKAHRLQVTRRYFWCDSSTVLHWIYNNTRQYKTYEANRLGEIDELTKPSEWRFVPTALNVADIATRETFNYQSFLNEWFKGPTFLKSTESNWPENVIEPANEDYFAACVTVIQNTPVGLPIPNPERFSSWLRFVRSAAAVLKFINKCRGITALDDFALMEQAKQLVLRQAQEDSFASDMQAIRSSTDLQSDSRLRNLSPYLDENGILRVSGRIDAVCDVPQETKRPIILDGRHPTTRLLVRHYHVKAAHGHQEAVVNDLKQVYWIIRLRPTVKNVASRCMLCRLRKANPQMPRMGDLPRARMAHHQRAFTYCGIDLFGPMEVTVGRRREKRYGVLFTCLTVRAVHIEIVHSLTTDSLIMALRRMASRRGWPAHIYSDNGTNLRGADVELRRSIEELDEGTLRTEAVNNQAQWTFIPPASPHWGGAWERLIRSVKRSLHVILKERAPRDETLSTLLLEVESIINGRPLTHVSVEPGSTEALTPNHFLIGSSSKLPLIGAFDDSDLALRKQWRIAQRLADMYWKRWLKEFLPLLLPRRKWQQEQRPLCVGDLVLVVDPDSPRNMWPRGIIKSVVPGKDGRVRVVEVRTSTGVLRRSVARVAPVPVAN